MLIALGWGLLSKRHCNACSVDVTSRVLQNFIAVTGASFLRMYFILLVELAFGYRAGVWFEDNIFSLHESQLQTQTWACLIAFIFVLLNSNLQVEAYVLSLGNKPRVVRRYEVDGLRYLTLNAAYNKTGLCETFKPGKPVGPMRDLIVTRCIWSFAMCSR